MPRAGPKKVQRYSLEFKLKAVKLSQLKGVEVQAVAEALDIHPFMLSRWRKEAREGRLRGTGARTMPASPKTPAREIRSLTETGVPPHKIDLEQTVSKTGDRGPENGASHRSSGRRTNGR